MDEGSRLPNLVLAGTTKAGTTSLSSMLRQHPDVFGPMTKEINHFSRVLYGEPPPPVEAYLQHFARAGDERWRLDVSPFYLVGGGPTARAVAETLDRPRVLITLRDPVERLWSSYRYKRSKGHVARGVSFSDFFDQCLAHYEAGTDLRAEHANFLTLRTGRYAEHLPAWLTTFGTDLRIVVAEELSAQPQPTMRALFAWLDVDPTVADRLDYAERNVTAQPRSLATRRLAHRVNRALAPVLVERPAWANRARSVYQRLNDSRGAQARLTDHDRRRVAAFYSDSNATTASLLRDHGLEAPAWAGAGA